ncbi:DUF554 domain-containing protein, partial [Clostridium sp.]|uniref:DUF554 domain-containing protein n=1 Tax=Clostridium sp. TaxID=1506 RepID=UPI002FC79FA9
MLGTIVNFLAIVGGALLGLFLKGGIPEKVSNTVMQSISLCILYIGISGAFKVENMLVVIICMSIGAVTGELADLDNILKKLGDWLQNKFKNSESKISEGFVSASLLYCVGAMAIVGSLESGLQGKHDILFSKSILDGVSAIIFSSTLGIGVMFSGVSVLIYQGLITLCAAFLSPVLSTAVIANMTACGSLIIIG